MFLVLKDVPFWMSGEGSGELSDGSKETPPPWQFWCCYHLKVRVAKPQVGWGCLLCISLVHPVAGAEPCKSCSGFVAERVQHMLSISSSVFHKALAALMCVSIPVLLPVLKHQLGWGKQHRQLECKGICSVAVNAACGFQLLWLLLPCTSRAGFLLGLSPQHSFRVLSPFWGGPTLFPPELGHP